MKARRDLGQNGLFGGTGAIPAGTANAQMHASHHESSLHQTPAGLFGKARCLCLRTCASKGCSETLAACSGGILNEVQG